jgi:galactokinase
MEDRDVLLAFDEAFGAGGERHLAFAPGRVNLIGDHTDYADGFALPMTLDVGTYVVARTREDGSIRVVADGHGTVGDFELGGEVRPERPLWERYVLGTAAEVASMGEPRAGMELLIKGDLPVSAGLSSSASLTVAVAMAAAAAWEIQLSPRETALLAQRVEHRYAGVNCGIMDQLAICFGKEGHALLLDCRTLEHEYVPLPEGHAIVVVDSGVSRDLAASAYNERRAAVERAAEILTSAMRRPVKALRDVSREELDQYAGHLEAETLARARHVVNENERVLDAARAMQHGDVKRFGELMTASHESLRDLYEVSGKELDVLVDEGLAAGSIGSRLTGAGFGGSTVHLVPCGALETFEHVVPARYRERTGCEARVLVIRKNRAVLVSQSQRDPE